MSDCIFCKIIKHEIPSSIVCESQNTIAFLDINPINPGHVLIVPKKHFTLIAELPSEISNEMFDLAKIFSTKLRASLKCTGVNLMLADGESAGQTVFHPHLHVIPRYKGDGFGLTLQTKNHPSREELDSMVQKIRL